jgi:hypothetical protein
MLLEVKLFGHSRGDDQDVAQVLRRIKAVVHR